MEKAEGIPLHYVWDGLTPSEKLKILLQVSNVMKAWVDASVPWIRQPLLSS